MSFTVSLRVGIMKPDSSTAWVWLFYKQNGLFLHLVGGSVEEMQSKEINQGNKECRPCVLCTVCTGLEELVTWSHVCAFLSQRNTNMQGPGRVS